MNIRDTRNNTLFFTDSFQLNLLNYPLTHLHYLVMMIVHLNTINMNEDSQYIFYILTRAQSFKPFSMGTSKWIRAGHPSIVAYSLIREVLSESYRRQRKPNTWRRVVPLSPYHRTEGRLLPPNQSTGEQRLRRTWHMSLALLMMMVRRVEMRESVWSSAVVAKGGSSHFFVNSCSCCFCCLIYL